MKKILFVTAFVPGRFAAGENFTRQLLDDISLNNCIDLVYFKYSNENNYQSSSPNVRVIRVFKNSIPIKILNAMMFPVIFPLFSVRFNLLRLAAIRKRIHQKHYDLLIFDFSQTFLYARFINKIPVILIAHDVIMQRFSRIYGGVFTTFCRFTEKFVLSKIVSGIFTFSEKDKLLLSQNYSVNASVTHFYMDKLVVDSTPESVGDYYVFFANWRRDDNAKGLRKFIVTTYPKLMMNTKIKIIGPGLPHDIRDSIQKYSGIEYLGFLDNPYQVITNARAVISPLTSGAGVKVKVLESFGCGTHVFGFPVTFEGISQIYSEFMILSHSYSELADSINNFTVDLISKLNLKKLFMDTYKAGSIARFINSDTVKGD